MLLVMAKSAQLNSLLTALIHGGLGIEAASVISADGLTLASAGPNIAQPRVSAVSTALVSLGVQAALELRKGELSQLAVFAKDGDVLLTRAGPNAVLVIVAALPGTSAQLTFEAARAAAQISAIL